MNLLKGGTRRLTSSSFGPRQVQKARATLAARPTAEESADIERLLTEVRKRQRRK